MKNEPASKGSSTWMLLLGAVIIVLIVIVVIVFATAPSPTVNNQTPIASQEVGGTQSPDLAPATDTGDDTAEEAAQVEEALGNDTQATEESGVVSPADSEPSSEG